MLLDFLLNKSIAGEFCVLIEDLLCEVSDVACEVEKLKEIIPRQQFAFKIQGKALGRIISSESVSAFRKDVLMHGSKVVGGGDVSRKKKLLEKQKKGKKRMQSSAKINISHEVFLKMMRSSNDK